MTMQSPTSATKAGGEALAELLERPDARFMADGGLETTLVFHDGLDLPDFAAFPLLDSPDGREALGRYYQPYLAIAEAREVGIVVDTPTWRANPDWGTRLGYDRDALAAVNRSAVRMMAELAEQAPSVATVINGAIGPRGDGYVVGETMSPAESASYHSLQIRAFSEAGADMVTAVTMTYVAEAIGITRAAVEVGIPVVIGFTVETDGRLPSGTTLPDAIAAVDAATGGAPVWYMVNCAHPSHFADVFNDASDDGSGPGNPWLARIKAVRANASRMSHAELDEAPELDRGDPRELAADYAAIDRLLPELRVVGGCCGTDHEHIDEIVAALQGR